MREGEKKTETLHWIIPDKTCELFPGMWKILQGLKVLLHNIQIILTGFMSNLPVP